MLHPATLRRLFVRCAYGLSWQVVPTKLAEWAKDPAGFQRVMRGDADEETRYRDVGESVQREVTSDVGPAFAKATDAAS